MKRIALILIIGFLLIINTSNYFAQSGTSLPATCTVNDVFTFTGVSPPINVICLTTNFWSVVVLPTNLITFTLESTCPTGFTEVTNLNGKMPLGTIASNGDVGTTGGADNITPAGSINTHPSTVATLAIGPTSTLTGLGNHTFTGTQFDNRSSFIKVIFCRRS